MIFPDKRYSERYTNTSGYTVDKKVKMEIPFQEDNIEYVLMPWDDETTIFVEGDGMREPHSRWDLIEKQLKTAQISDIGDFVNVIKSYNVVFEKNGDQKKPNWKCPVLHQYFTQLNEFEKERFFGENGVLSTIRTLALQLKELVPKLKILKTGYNSSLELHQLQVASLLSHAFFCTFPKRKADCPSINYNTLYEGASGAVLKYYTEKIKCLMHYFKRIHIKQPSGNLSFHRLNIPDHKFPRWDKTTAGLCSLKVDVEGKIEDQEGFLQMDFANKYIGGGVLGKGCVQEEIRFLISPELIVARLFTECLADNEALFVVGSERFCNYTGYSKTFAFNGDYEDKTPFDEKRRRKSYIIIVDALYFHHSSDQYRESKILRELKKAYVGFKSFKEFRTLPLATGNWGCGAFGGDPQLKTILQLMASSQACRDVLYLTFGNFVLKKQIQEFYVALQKKAVNVGTLYRIIRNFNKERKKNQTVFEFVIESLNRMEEKQCILKSVPSTSKEASAFETGFSIESTKTKPKARESFVENFPELNLDFEALDKKVQKFSKDNSSIMHYSKEPSERKFERLREHSNILDKMWYENELDSVSAKSQEEHYVKDRTVCEENSPSLFSDEEVEIDCKRFGNKKNVSSESSECLITTNSSKKTENEAVCKSQCKKVIQPKIDFFFKK